MKMSIVIFACAKWGPRNGGKVTLNIARPDSLRARLYSGRAGQALRGREEAEHGRDAAIASAGLRGDGANRFCGTFGFPYWWFSVFKLVRRFLSSWRIIQIEGK